MDPSIDNFFTLRNSIRELKQSALVKPKHKNMENKNLSPKDACVRRIKIHNTDSSWKDVILNINRIKDIFANCIILLHNCEVDIFTSISQTVLFNLRKDSIKNISRLVHDFDQLCSIYGSTHTFLIYWNDENDCRVLPKCSDSAKLFEYVLVEKDAHVPPHLNVSLESLLGTCQVPRQQLFDEYTVNYILTGTHYPQNVALWRQEDDIVLERKSTVSLKGSMKIIPARNEWTYTVLPVNGGFPTQVSNTQDSASDNSVTFSFENGSLFSVQPGSRGRIQRQDISSPEINNVIPEHNNVTFGSRPRRQPRYPQYVDPIDRFATFAHWTRRSPKKRQLSDAGFFFTNNGDLVRCYQCGIGLKDFTEDDDPLLEHVRHSGDCEYLFDHLGPSGLAEMRSTLRLPDQQRLRRNQLQQQSENPAEINYTCRHPELSTIEARLRTFARWPSSIIQTARQLAEAGLYYTGTEDHVRCFACDGGLRRWDAEDDPWTEHCRWFPACPFARQQKGDEYIALIQASVDQDENTAAGGIDVTRTLAQMTLRDPQFRAIMNEHKQACLDMGFKEEDFNDTVEELRNRGIIKPTLEEIIDNIEIVKENREAAKRLEAAQNETPEEENKRLKKIFKCMKCERNTVNALFLPCTHHKLCMQCSEPLTKCPVCDRNIREKIKTFLA